MTDKTPYDQLGGAAGVRDLVNRFYDVMDQDPMLGELRTMHAPDLTPMRQKLFEFMSGWLGGPPLYFERPDHPCIVSAHRAFPIGAKERDQWLSAMHRALTETSLSSETQQLLRQALFQTADALRNS